MACLTGWITTSPCDNFLVPQELLDRKVAEDTQPSVPGVDVWYAVPHGQNEHGHNRPSVAGQYERAIGGGPQAIVRRRKVPLQLRRNVAAAMSLSSSGGGTGLRLQ
jgi:hypothetical protein